MNWFLMFVAFLIYAGERTANLSSDQQIFLYLTKLASVEQFLLLAGLVILVVGALLAVVIGTKSAEGGVGCGCSLAYLGIYLFIGSGIGYLLTQGMLSGFSPALGVVEPVKFYICLVLFLVTGVG